MTELVHLYDFYVYHLIMKTHSADFVGLKILTDRVKCHVSPSYSVMQPCDTHMPTLFRD